MSNAATLILLVFLAITFLQSGLDKIVDWKGNLGWLKGHFSQTFFKSAVPVLLGVITVFELLSGALAVAGLVTLFSTGDKTLAMLAAIFSAASLLMLFLGQRLAKDYEGARTLVVYLIPTVILIVLLSE